jgi:hypothetical protein
MLGRGVCRHEGDRILRLCLRRLVMPLQLHEAFAVVAVAVTAPSDSNTVVNLIIDQVSYPSGRALRGNGI